jgi:hypothetical protein
MDYLYGDSTPSPLRSNFLEFLRDAMDFSVFVLDADDRIARGNAQLRALEAESAVELERLERFVALVARAIKDGEKGASDSPASRCAARLGAATTEVHHATIEEVRRQIAEATAQVEAAESALRTACREALAKLLAAHEPHEASITTRLTTRAAGPFDARLTGELAIGLAWTFELGTEPTDLWRAPLRVDAVAPQLEIRAPQMTGWISKEVKVRPQRIDRHFVTELADDGTTVVIKLRAEIGADAGFDLEVDPSTKQVKAARTGAPTDDSVGPFEVAEEDVAPLVALADKLRTSARSLKPGNLVEATVDGEPFRTQPTFAVLVERLVGMMTPVVRTIAERSLTPNELVLRRLLGDDRREELFVPKAVLREKYAMLPRPLAALFAPLALDAPAQATPRATLPLEDAPAVRAQIARSEPPAPRVPTARPPVTDAAAVPPPASPPAGSAPEARLSRPGSEPSIEITAELDDDLEPEITSEEVLAAAPQPPDATPLASAGGTRNEPLRASLKQIALLARSGRTDEAYGRYASLFESAPFADYRPDDQRQALRLMVLAKAPPDDRTEAVLGAYRAAVARLEALIAALKEPADYELLGVAYTVLDDATAAEKAIRAGLELERERNPSSDLCGNLMRRLSAL